MSIGTFNDVTPRSFTEAKTRMRLARAEREVDEKEKANTKGSAKANKLYNEKIIQEMRDTRAREKKERNQLKADKAKEAAEPINYMAGPKASV
jgi:hypothetical protein